MKLTNWFLNFDFGSRARRSHMWANSFSWMGIMLILVVLTFGVGSQSKAMAAAGGVALFVAVIAYVIDSMAMTFRRAHDTSKSGWIFLLLYLPLVNLWALYVLLIEDSQQGPNKYGPPVKAFYTPQAAV